jgi:predicted HTH transcriptional regulator
LYSGCDYRFIIYGVSEDKVNGGYSITGLNSIKFPDDANLQPVFELIYPRPIIHTGTVSFRNKIIGYIHIDKANTDFPYEAVGINSLNKEAIFQGI